MFTNTEQARAAQVNSIIKRRENARKRYEITPATLREGGYIDLGEDLWVRPHGAGRGFTLRDQDLRTSIIVSRAGFERLKEVLGG